MGATAGPDTVHGAPISDFKPKFRVVAPLVLVRSADRQQLHHCYQGCELTWLSDEQEQHFVGDGLVERITDK